MNYLIPIVVGAVIGYFTNLLAIKMLFKPHYEKRILGLKVPFTPGLIPKERTRIANSIGDVVGEHLLTPDTIIQSLYKEENTEKIKEFIDEKLQKIKEDNKSILQLLNENNLNENDKLIVSLKEKISNLIIEEIKKPLIKEKIYGYIENKIDNADLSLAYDFLNNKMNGIWNNILNSNEIKSSMVEFIESKIKNMSSNEQSLREVLPSELINYIKKYIEDIKNHIGSLIRDTIKIPEVQVNLKLTIASLVRENINRMIAAFISPDTISEKVFESIEKYLNEKEAEDTIISFILLIIDKVLVEKTSTVINKIEDITTLENINKVVDFMLLNIGDRNIKSNITKIINSNIRDNEKLLKEKSKDILSKEIHNILNGKELDEVIMQSVDNILSEYINKPVANIFLIDYNTTSEVFYVIKSLSDKFIEKDLINIIEIFNISNIVENKINGFDIEFTEKLILDIADKELKAITWLGALLGGIMGILTPLLQNLY